MGVSRAYVDTHYLLDVVFDGKHKRHTEHLFSQINNNSFLPLMPQIVIGETFSQICERCADRTRLDHLTGRFVSLVEKYRWDNANMPSPSKRSFQIAADLASIDDRIVGVDAELLSIALADQDSKFLFTRDTTLLNNKRICDYELRLRHDGERSTRLKIGSRL